MTLPLTAIWLDADGIAAAWSYEPRVIAEKITKLPDFPKPARIGNRGHARWNAAEVDAWMRAWQDQSLSATDSISGA